MYPHNFRLDLQTPSKALKFTYNTCIVRFYDMRVAQTVPRELRRTKWCIVEYKSYIHACIHTYIHTYRPPSCSLKHSSAKKGSSARPNKASATKKHSRTHHSPRHVPLSVIIHDMVSLPQRRQIYVCAGQYLNGKSCILLSWQLSLCVRAVLVRVLRAQIC